MGARKKAKLSSQSGTVGSFYQSTDWTGLADPIDTMLSMTHTISRARRESTGISQCNIRVTQSIGLYTLVPKTRLYTQRLSTNATQ